ncbi:Hypothetical predicted protein [Pelobates cultripes]|nr:Hypothetical predicted protein [Pelobates cultripes]
MANSRAVNPPQQSAEEWAAAFQAKFEAVCRKFWERLERRNLPPALKLAAKAERQPMTPHMRPRHGNPTTIPQERPACTTRKVRQRGNNRPKRTSRVQATAAPPPTRGSHRPISTQKCYQGLKRARHQQRPKGLQPLLHYCTTSSDVSDTRGRSIQLLFRHPANSRVSLQPGLETPQLKHACKHTVQQLPRTNKKVQGDTATPHNHKGFLPQTGVG